MYYNEFNIYEGRDPYIFVSYSHADQQIVSAILHALYQKGWRVWFDKGIKWGDEWPESIANHLSAAEVCLAFHSKASAKSNNCRQELYYALKKQKTILSIYLEKVTLHDGLIMRLSPFQSINYYDFQDMDSFLARVEDSTILASCRNTASESINLNREDMPKNSEAFNIDAELEKLFGNNKKKQNQTLSPLMKKVQEKQYWNVFWPINSDIEENSSKVPNLHTGSEKNDEIDEGFNGKYFSIIESDGFKTMVYRINHSLDFVRFEHFYQPELVISAEEPLADGRVKRTFFIDYPEPNGEDLVILSCSSQTVFVNMGKLLGSTVKISREPIKVNLQDEDKHINNADDTRLYVDGKLWLNSSAYNFGKAQIMNEQAFYGSEPTTIDYDAKITRDAFIIVDPETATEVHRDVYSDTVDSELKAKISLLPLKHYFVFSIFTDDDKSSYPMSNLEIAKFYRLGWVDGKKNIEKAVEYLEKDGSGDALYQIACIFLEDEEYMDVEMGTQYLKLAADAGNKYAQSHLGFCYQYGQGVEHNEAEAVKWYRKAAEQGDIVAQNTLGNCYLDGIGVEYDEAEAFRLFSMAAKQGNLSAQNNLGYCYQHGIGIAENENEAVKWYRKAAELGNATAQKHLGDCYCTGYGVGMDKVEAVKWYQVSAEQGYKKAQKNLGDCYYYGEGVSENKAEALIWYRKAAEQGDMEAQDAIVNKAFPTE